MIFRKSSKKERFEPLPPSLAEEIIDRLGKIEDTLRFHDTMIHGAKSTPTPTQFDQTPAQDPVTNNPSLNDMLLAFRTFMTMSKELGSQKPIKEIIEDYQALEEIGAFDRQDEGISLKDVLPFLQPQQPPSPPSTPSPPTPHVTPPPPEISSKPSLKDVRESPQRLPVGEKLSESVAIEELLTDDALKIIKNTPKGLAYSRIKKWINITPEEFDEIYEKIKKGN